MTPHHPQGKIGGESQVCAASPSLPSWLLSIHQDPSCNASFSMQSFSKREHTLLEFPSPIPLNPEVPCPALPPWPGGSGLWAGFRQGFDAEITTPSEYEAKQVIPAVCRGRVSNVRPKKAVPPPPSLPPTLLKRVSASCLGRGALQESSSKARTRRG